MKYNFKKIYCDFDGTISTVDSVNKFLSVYADKSWLKIEDLWIQGKISSKDCIEKQVKLLPKIDENTLNRFINSIEIDKHFIDFYNYLNFKNIEIIILSDGFDLFIKKTLERYNLDRIKYFANTISYKDNEISISFNNHNSNCDIKSGFCKCSQINEQDFCYIGDGISDFCAAKKAKIVFAKNNLKKYCGKNNLKHIEFTTFKDILKAFKN